MSLPSIQIIGTMVADPELRFTASGTAVANFTVAANERRKNQATGDWEDGSATFTRCNVWRQQAENVAETLTRGMRVFVTGRLKQRDYETREGEKRTVFELEVDECGPTLQFATAKVNKMSRGQGRSGSANGATGTRNDDPWSTQAPAAGAGQPLVDEAPF